MDNAGNHKPSTSIDLEAGSSSVIELHGTTRVIYCMKCLQHYSIEEAYSLLVTECPPLCSDCQGILRPAVVFFGEPLNPEILHLEKRGQATFS